MGKGKKKKKKKKLKECCEKYLKKKGKYCKKCPLG
jgi:ferric iron reductase protein FhuF